MLMSTPRVLMPLLQASIAPDLAPIESTSLIGLPFHILPSQKMWQSASMCVVA